MVKRFCRLIATCALGMACALWISCGNSRGGSGSSGDGSSTDPGVAEPPITVPTSLDPGDEYRLAFVTSERRNGLSSEIPSYNTFVTSVANTQPALALLGTTWKAIGSTATVDARDNNGTNPDIEGVGVPIFLLNDTLLANDNLDFWDGSILVPFEIDEGGTAISLSFVWTGTTSSGVVHPFPLGSEEPVIGTTG